MRCNGSSEINDKTASLDYLMSRFAVQRTLWLAKAIVCQIENYLKYPSQEIEEHERYRRILPLWQAITDQMEEEETIRHEWRFSLRLFYKQQFRAAKAAC